MTSSIAIGIDLGGTNLKGAVISGDGRILAKRTIPTDTSRGPEAVITEMVTLVDTLLRDIDAPRSRLRGVGVGAPGPLSQTKGRIIRTANLPGWVDVPLRDLLAERVGRPVVLENDGNAAAFGEYWAGSGELRDDLVMLTLGTGVGAGVVLGGRVLHGHFENAAELGHTIVVDHGLPCPCGQRGCLEQYASAAGVARRVAAAVLDGEASVLADSIRGGAPVDSAEVARAARAGDALCRRVWEEACIYLAVTCINIQHAFNPARIVLGGGMAEAGAFLLDSVTEHVNRRRWRLHDDVPAIGLAGLGYDAGVIGAAALVLAGWPTSSEVGDAKMPQLRIPHR